MKTSTLSVTKVSRAWHLIDADNQVLGRLATHIAELLMGKNKTDFVRYLDIADHVVVVNASKVAVTGNKATQKIYHRHSGWPGGMTVTTFSQMMTSHPDRIIIKAVSGMIPRNKLHDKLLSHLHVYPTSVHPYTDQFKQSN